MEEPDVPQLLIDDILTILLSYLPIQPIGRLSIASKKLHDGAVWRQVRRLRFIRDDIAAADQKKQISLLSSLNGEHLSKVESLEIDASFSGLFKNELPWFGAVMAHVKTLSISFAATIVGNLEERVAQLWNSNLIESLTLHLGRPRIRRDVSLTTWPKLKYLKITGTTTWEEDPTPPTAPNLEHLHYEGLFRNLNPKNVVPMYPKLKQLHIDRLSALYPTFAEECMELFGLPLDKINDYGVPGWEIAYRVRTEVGLRRIEEAAFGDDTSAFLQSLQRICNIELSRGREDSLPTLVSTLKRLIATNRFHVDPVLIECVVLVSILAEKVNSPENSLKGEFENLLDFAACPLASLASVLMGNSTNQTTHEITNCIDCALFVRDNSGRHQNFASIVISLLASIVSNVGVRVLHPDSIKTIAPLVLQPSFTTLPKRDSSGANMYPSAVFILDLIEEFDSNTTWLELLPFLRKAASQGAASIGKGRFLAAAMLKSPEDSAEVKEAKVLYVCSYQATMALASDLNIAGTIFDCDGSYSRIFALQDIWNQRFGAAYLAKRVSGYYRTRECAVFLIFESAVRTADIRRICRAFCDTVDFGLPPGLKRLRISTWNDVEEVLGEIFASPTCKLSQEQRQIVTDRLKEYFIIESNLTNGKQTQLPASASGFF